MREVIGHPTNLNGPRARRLPKHRLKVDAACAGRAASPDERGNQRDEGGNQAEQPHLMREAINPMRGAISVGTTATPRQATDEGVNQHALAGHQSSLTEAERASWSAAATDEGADDAANDAANEGASSANEVAISKPSLRDSSSPE